MCSSGSGTTQDAQRSENAFSKELQADFEAQFGANTRLTSLINGQMWNQINAGGEGYSKPALAAMRAQAADSIAGNFQHAQHALQEHEAQTGGNDLPSGVNAQLDAGLYAKEAEQQAAAANDITLANENQRQQNYWRAIGTLSGNNAARNPLGYASAANGGAGAEAALSNANTNANDSGMGGAFSQSFGASLGKAGASALVGDGAIPGF